MNYKRKEIEKFIEKELIEEIKKQLHLLSEEERKEIEEKVNEELEKKGESMNLILNAFIVSVSSYDEIKNTFGDRYHSTEEFYDHNILFQEDENYIKKIFEKVGMIKNYK